MKPKHPQGSTWFFASFEVKIHQQNTPAKYTGKNVIYLYEL